MNEIERASIEQAIIELEVMRRECNRPCGQMQSIIDKNQRRTEIIRLCKSVLRAELDRQDAKPLTCDGCKHESEKLEPMCYFCTRIRSDRYEPKGEKE